MKLLTSLFILMACLLPSPLIAEAWSGSGKTIFKGTSTLHDFEGQVKSTILAEHGQKGWTLRSKVDVKSMTTDHKKRDRNMKKMFEVATYPNINILLENFDPKGKSQDVEVSLTIRKVSKKIKAKVSNWKKESGEVSFSMELSLSLKNFGLKAPGALWGIIQVRDKIKVQTTVKLKPVEEEK